MSSHWLHLSSSTSPSAAGLNGESPYRSPPASGTPAELRRALDSGTSSDPSLVSLCHVLMRT